MSWKDDWREQKSQTDLTWDEYHREYFTHDDDLSDLRETLERIDEHLQAVTTSYDRLRETIQDVKALLEIEYRKERED